METNRKFIGGLKKLLLLIISVMLVVFARAETPQELCEQNASLDWYVDTCYECAGEIVVKDNKLSCILCNEDFVLVGNECKLKESEKTSNPTFLDKLLNKYFPNNPMFGFIMLVLVLGVIIYIFLNRKKLKIKFKKK